LHLKTAASVSRVGDLHSAGTTEFHTDEPASVVADPRRYHFDLIKTYKLTNNEHKTNSQRLFFLCHKGSYVVIKIRHSNRLQELQYWSFSQAYS